MIAICGSTCRNMCLIFAPIDAEDLRKTEFLGEDIILIRVSYL